MSPNRALDQALRVLVYNLYGRAILGLFQSTRLEPLEANFGHNSRCADSRTTENVTGIESEEFRMRK
jgi:hypothetical protein